MTPEEILGLIGNIANRPDIREVQERQVKEIKALILENRRDAIKAFHKTIDDSWKSARKSKGTT